MSSLSLRVALLAALVKQTYGQAYPDDDVTVTVWQSCGLPTYTMFPSDYGSFSSSPATLASSSTIPSSTAPSSTCSISTLAAPPAAAQTAPVQSGTPDCPALDTLDACGASDGITCTDSNGNPYTLQCGVGPSCGTVIPGSILKKRGFASSLGACIAACDATFGCTTALYRVGVTAAQACTLFAEAYNFIPIAGARVASRPLAPKSSSSTALVRSPTQSSSSFVNSLPVQTYNPMPQSSRVTNTLPVYTYFPQFSAPSSGVQSSTASSGTADVGTSGVQSSTASSSTTDVSTSDTQSSAASSSTTDVGTSDTGSMTYFPSFTFAPSSADPTSVATESDQSVSTVPSSATPTSSASPEDTNTITTYSPQFTFSPSSSDSGVSSSMDMDTSQATSTSSSMTTTQPTPSSTVTDMSMPSATFGGMPMKPRHQKRYNR